MFTDGPCDTEGTCDFEHGSCVYSNSDDDNFDWLLGSGQRSNPVAPPIDHTVTSSYGMLFNLH